VFRAQPLEPGIVQHGPIARAIFVLLGGVAALGCGGFALFLIFMFARAALRGSFDERRLLLQVGSFSFLAALLLSGCAAYGFNLALRGVRGRSRARFVPAEAWYRRNWYPAGVVVYAMLAGAGFLAAASPEAFLSGDGPLPLRVGFTPARPRASRHWARATRHTQRLAL